MNATQDTVGVVGLGIMGGAIAKNLAAASWRVIGHDIDAARRDEAAAAGIEIVAGAGRVAARAAAIITSLPHPDALAATVHDITAAALPPRVLVEVSTFALDDKTRAEKVLRAAGHVALDCPLSGTGAQARTRDLVV